MARSLSGPEQYPVFSQPFSHFSPTSFKQYTNFGKLSNHGVIHSTGRQQ